MRIVSVVTVARSDFGIYLPVLRRIEEDPALKLCLIVAGMHMMEEYGATVNDIIKEGFEIDTRVVLPLRKDSPEGIAESVASAVKAFAGSYANNRPDILLVLGDRFEMHAAALAALPFKIPVAHIHGGELTRGAIDDSLRHSITKLSHLHFVAAEDYGRRVRQLGEEPWRVIFSGAPALDSIKTMKFLTREELARKFNFPLAEPCLLATYHPVTLEYEETQWQVGELLGALAAVNKPVVFTAPNADTNNRLVGRMIQTFVKDRPKRARFVANFGPDFYFSMLNTSLAMVGNSSSGLIEAPSFELPVVNIGTRQEGRLRAKNVIDIGYPKGEIVAAINKALSQEFQSGLKGMKNPYGEGNAAEIIVRHLKEVRLDKELIFKKFYDEKRIG